MPADEFRSVNDAFLPDVRHGMDGQSLKEHHARVAAYPLDDTVPESIATQYDVARNLYLHAWSVYRFYMVAQHQVLVVLEMAIRERFGKAVLSKFARANGLRPGLAAYIRFLRTHDWLRNEDFPVWRHRRRMNAEQTYQLEIIQKMDELGLKEYSFDHDEVDVDLYHFDYDYMAVLEESIAPIRNEHAHGSKMLYPMVLGTFELTSIIINKMYAEKR